jgi:erythromycin esterase-like protein
MVARRARAPLAYKLHRRPRPQAALQAPDEAPRGGRGAERYQRAMFRASDESRSCATDTCRDARRPPRPRLAPRHPARALVCAHHSHIGDARATEMGQCHGELNLGQLAREAYGADALCRGSRRPPGRSPPHGTRRRPRSGAACALRSREAGRRCFTMLASSASCSSPARRSRAQAAARGVAGELHRCAT